MNTEKLKKHLLIYFIIIISIETLITIVSFIKGKEISTGWVSLLTLQFGILSTLIGILLADKVATAMRKRKNGQK